VTDDADERQQEGEEHGDSRETGREEAKSDDAGTSSQPAEGANEPPALEWPIILPDQRPAPYSLIQEAKSAATSARLAGDRKQVAAYRPPSCIVWGIERLARQIPKGGLDAAATLALEVGIGRLCGIPGVKDLRGARARALPFGDPEAMHFFDNFGLLNIEAGRAGTSRDRYVRDLPAGLVRVCGRIAADLGLSISILVTLAYCAALIGEEELVPRKYQQALYDTLCHFRDRVARRLVQAQDYLRADPIAQSDGRPQYSFDDVIRRKAPAALDK
jgi:hypothetical protein